MVSALFSIRTTIARTLLIAVGISACEEMAMAMPKRTPAPARRLNAPRKIAATITVKIELPSVPKTYTATRKLGANRDPLLALLWTQLLGLRALLDALRHDLLPVYFLTEQDTDAEAENRQKNNRRDPAWAVGDLFKRRFGAEQRAEHSANVVDRSLRFWRRGRTDAHRV